MNPSGCAAKAWTIDDVGEWARRLQSKDIHNGVGIFSCPGDVAPAAAKVATDHGAGWLVVDNIPDTEFDDLEDLQAALNRWQYPIFADFLNKPSLLWDMGIYEEWKVVWLRQIAMTAVYFDMYKIDMLGYVVEGGREGCRFERDTLGDIEDLLHRVGYFRNRNINFIRLKDVDSMALHMKQHWQGIGPQKTVIYDQATRDRIGAKPL
mmetsp:Transcript_34933/g.77670  ORF Transcript_34933/g.77670 Transcript_34933/m.77670 type:complete len:207 (-) Transcript_34933:1389-2009(-)|eukprot:CAMPEP_0202897534 /NCGR_PEP_ID=MMETSP1392-20130828/6273_1 /ASSEMBLY_ACC=CAM_ASM_000868 /TAXON_ID=225041 /ORGANISM="Chlamydomonas chlamydogama, Strain SAG 11-48b" /LENGTH=206 /DNA_ID=CAMNT_0049583205 /DNA_START=85 /DNA_END=705 /DNA_ORIENTATION=+